MNVRCRRLLVLGLLAFACKKPAPVQPTPPQKAVPTADLVRVGTIGDAPPDPVEIAIAADGRIVTASGEVDLDGLRAHLAALAGKTKGLEPNLRNVVLRVHPSLPWEVVAWTLGTCAQARAYRIHFAVRPEEGEDEGTMAVFLPWDQGINVEPIEPQVAPPSLAVFVFAHERLADDRAAYATYRGIFSATPTAAVVDGQTGVAAGHMIRTVDLLLRAGASGVEFRVSMPPRTTAGRTWLQEYVASHPAKAKGFGVRVGNRELVGGEAPAAPAPPPVARVRGRVAGYAPEGAHGIPELGLEFDEPGPVPNDTDDLADEPFFGPTINSAIGQGGGAGRGRRSRRALRAGGGSAFTEDAVELGLQWLADHQDDVDEDGRWDCDGFMKHDPPGKRCDGAGQAFHDVGVTGLAVLAFLGAGYTDRGSAKENKYAKNVRAGLRYLLQSQADDGVFGTRSTRSFMYDHAIATLAMCEAFWMTRNPRYKKPAQDGLYFIALARNPGGAWRYDPRGGENDTSVTSWCVMALKAGKYAGLEVDPDVFEGARSWIDKMTDPGLGKVGYNATGGVPARPAMKQEQFPPEKSQSMTAAGILCRIYLGEDPRMSEMIRKGAALCAECPPRWEDDGSIDMYYWYYGTLALFQVGGEPWHDWNDAMKEAVLKHQHQKDAGSRAGSWDPIDAWGEDGGRVYSTAMLVLCLEVYYRYDRVFGTK